MSELETNLNALAEPNGLKTLSQDSEVLTREELAVILDSTASLRDRALLAILYLTNSRVGEIVRRLRKNQITRTLNNDRPILVFVGLHTEKNREHPKRNIPVVIEKEKSYVNIIEAYASLPQFSDESILFPISRQRAWTILKNLCGERCHALRHSRITHLITYYGLNSEAIRRMAGWSDERMMATYSHLRWQDIASMMG